MQQSNTCKLYTLSAIDLKKKVLRIVFSEQRRGESPVLRPQCCGKKTLEGNQRSLVIIIIIILNKI